MDFTKLLTLLTQKPELLAALVALAPVLIALFGKTPTVNGAPRTDDDEYIPPPPGVPVTPPAPASLAGYTLTAKIVQAQYNAKLFPKEYTDDNPMGLYPQSILRRVEKGEVPLSRSSKFWFDLTLRTPEGREIQGDELTARGLAFRARHEIRYADGSIAFQEGQGGTGEGALVQEAGWIGWGGAKWATSHGMNLACKAFGEGEVTLVGSMAGITSNSLKIKVS